MSFNSPYYFLRRGAELQRISVGGHPFGVTKVEPIGPIGVEWSLNTSFAFNDSGYADIFGRDTDGNLGLWLADPNGHYGAVRIIGNVDLEWDLQLMQFRPGSSRIDILGHCRTPGLPHSERVQAWHVEDGKIVGNTMFTLPVTRHMKLYPGDFDGDGIVDLIGINTRTDSPQYLLMIFIEEDRDRLRFGPEVSLGSIGREWKLAVADMNGDGIADLVGTRADNRLGMWINEGERGERFRRKLTHYDIGGLGLEWLDLQFSDIDIDRDGDVVAHTADGAIGGWRWSGSQLDGPDNLGTAKDWRVLAQTSLLQ